MMKRILLLCVLMAIALPAWAQQPVRALKQGISVDLGGGYAFTKFNAGQGLPNESGFFGVGAVNITPWLQLQADFNAQYRPISGASTRLYGNHFGPRVFYHPRSAPFRVFGEFLPGVSRLDLIVNGPGGSTFSENGFSFKLGGGADIYLSRRWVFRAFDVDYYRTSFLQTHQNNIWIATGVVFTLGGGRAPH